MKLYTTLNLLHQHEACDSGYADLLAHLGPDYDKDAPIDLLTILESCGLAACVLSLNATTERNRVRHEFLMACVKRRLAGYPYYHRSRNVASAVVATCVAAALACAVAAASLVASDFYAVIAVVVAASCSTVAATFCALAAWDDSKSLAAYVAAQQLELTYQTQLLREMLS
jgi:hypothetical protein